MPAAPWDTLSSLTMPDEQLDIRKYRRDAPHRLLTSIILPFFSVLLILVLIETSLAGMAGWSRGFQFLRDHPPLVRLRHAESSPAEELRRRYRDQVTSQYFVYDASLGVRFKPSSWALALEPDPTGHPRFATERRLAIDPFGFVANVSSTEKHFDYDRRAVDSQTYRIAVTGGSTTAGWGASDNEHTWPAVLERLLRERIGELFAGRFRDVWVINAGVFGYGITQEIIRFQNEILYLNPHLVISFNGINERWAYRGNPVDYGLKAEQYELMERTNRTSAPVNARVFPYLIEFLTHRSIVPVLPVERDYYGYKRPGFVEWAAADLYVSRVRQFKGVCAEAGISFVHCLQPAMGIGNRRLTAEELRLQHYMGTPFYQESWDEYTRKANAFYAQAGPKLTAPWHLNLVQLFDSTDETVYFDPRHYNDLGNRLIAEELCRLILRSAFAPEYEGAMGKDPQNTVVLNSSFRGFDRADSFELWNNGLPVGWELVGGAVQRSSDTTDGTSSVLMMPSAEIGTRIKKRFDEPPGHQPGTLRISLDTKSFQPATVSYAVYARINGRIAPVTKNAIRNSQWIDCESGLEFKSCECEVSITSEMDLTAMDVHILLRPHATDPATVDNLRITFVPE